MLMKMKKAQSTLEILIALAILVISIGAVISVVFDNRFATIFSSQQHQALFLAEKQIETLKAQAQENFDQLVSSTSGFDFFNIETNLQEIDFQTKKAEVKVSWSLTDARESDVSLTTILTNWRVLPPDDGTGPGDPPSGDWAAPVTAGTIDLGPGNEGTDVAVKDNIAYLTAKASASAKTDFFSINVSDIYNPVKLHDINTGKGLNSVAILGNYAYVTQNNSSGQLQVIDISNPSSLFVVATTTLPGVNEEGLGIAVKNQLVFVGSEEASGQEFQIFDVSNPAAPQKISGLEINADVKDIKIFDDRAYLAVNGSSPEFLVVNISDPYNPQQLISFDCASICSSSTMGLSVFPANLNTLLLGTNAGLVIFDTSNISNIAKKSSLAVGGQVNDIYAISYLAFLATSNSNTEFQVINISNLSSPYLFSSFNFPQVATGIAFRDNVVYTSVRSNDALRIITSTP
ncbi:MAG: hypothetical protein A2418_01315 [Candidatus Brennerbacteria bacterium RIFOXYC1_FULL_41_11]|nr:MAG: hypothetical protein A2418_01315 [Candidatus Brennerbacteria bacterium RIFOXYC1_FULL_41_11]